MAHVEDRWYRVVEGKKVQTERHGKGRRWRARWLEPDGHERSRSFDRRADADRHIKAVEGDKLRGTYVSPAAGRVTFEQYAKDWLAAQTFDEASRRAVEARLRVHVFPYLGGREVGAILPSHIQALLRALQQDLAPSHARVIFVHVSSVLSAAVDDEKIVKNPCRASSVKVPRINPSKIEPWPSEHVLAVRDALPERYRICATLAGGVGLRQGEVLGLAVEDIDFLRHIVHVRRQVKIGRGHIGFALPKGRKTRDVPLPEHVALELAAHIRAFPPADVSLPWEKPDGDPHSAALLVTRPDGSPVKAPHFTEHIWTPALRATGVEPARENGMHALRHWYASVLLDAGESIKAVSEYLGHASAAFTLATYTHLMPSSEQRTRQAVDCALGGPATSHGPATARENMNGPRLDHASPTESVGG